jgi:leucyl-tRNA synthetase
MEHTTLHLLYSRFWHRFLYDIGVVPTKEPYLKRTSHGMILGENGEKMSKSRGNVINPDDIVNEIGADSFRMYEMFMGAFDQAIPWSTKGARGCRRFLERVWRLQDLIKDEPMNAERDALLHATIKKVSEDYEQMKFNTAIAQMMAYVNDIYRLGSLNKEELRTLLLLLNPVAPHLTEEMWEEAGFENRLYQATWPAWDEKKLVKNEIEIVVQICGKIKAKLMVPADIDKAGMEKLVIDNETVKKLVEGKEIKKIVAVPGKLLNIVAI